MTSLRKGVQPTDRSRVRQNATMLFVVLAVAVTGVLLVRYGLSWPTGLLAAVVVAAGAWTGWRTRLRPDESTARVDAPSTVVVRRAVLTGAALTAAAAVGEARHGGDAVPSATDAPDPDVVSLTDLADLAVDRQDDSDPATWDWTPALRAAIDSAAERASSSERIDGTDAFRRTGLPTVYIPRGTYRLTGQVELTYLHGLTVRGDGRQVSVLQYEGDGVLFNVHRSSALSFTDLTVAGRDSAVDEEEDVQGLREGSCAFRFAEAADDTDAGGGSTYMATFSGLEVSEMHRAFAFAGDQMTDGMIWNDLHLRDNFVDFDYANNNAVNHQVFGGEVLYGVSFPEESYARRLSKWSARPDLRDGATVNATAGGDLSFFGGSVIVRKPTLAFGPPPQNGSQGAWALFAGFNFFGTRWEFRDRDQTGDDVGLQRSTLVRWRIPAPTNRWVQPTLHFSGCRFTVLAEDVDLLYIVNASAISWIGCRVFPLTRAQVVSVVTPETPLLAGAFFAQASSVLPVERRIIGEVGGGTDHIIEFSARGAPDVGPRASAAGYSTVIAGRPSAAQRVLYHAQSGNLLEPGQPTLRVTLEVPPGALLRQVGAVRLDDAPLPVSVSFSTDGGQIADLSLRLGQTKPAQLVEAFTDSGSVEVVVSRAGTPAVPGFVYVEYF